MAQYLDLTGLTYFKSKLLSSALNYDCNIDRYDEDTGDIIQQQIQIKANTAAQQNLDLIATDNEQYHRGTLSVNNTDIKLTIANYDYSLDWDISEGRSIGEFSCSDTLLKFYTSDGEEYRSGQSHDNIGDYEFSGTGFKISYNSNYNGVISIIGNGNGLTINSGSTPIAITGATTINSSISWASDPTNNNHLTRKSYVDNKFVDKTSNQTGIAGNKTWTGTQTWSGTLSHGCTVSNPSSQIYNANGYYSAKNSTGTYSSTSSEIRTPQNLSLSSSGNRTSSSDYSVYDYTSASLDITNGWTSGFTDLCKPRVAYSINSEGQTTGGNYAYYHGSAELYSYGIANNQKYFRVSHDTDAGVLLNSMTYNASGKFSLDYNYEWGAETTHMEIFPQNGDYYIGDPNTYGTVSLSDIVNAIATCFRGDTTYVTMYDGSKKLIQDVKVGDSVLGFDPNTQEYCESVVLANTRNRERQNYRTYVLSNGTTIDIYEDENFVVRQRGDEKKVVFLNSMKDLYDRWQVKEGQNCRRFFTDTPMSYDDSPFVVYAFNSGTLLKPVASYFLHTSTETYFVNGICGCQMTRNTASYFSARHIEVPENIQAIFAEIARRNAFIDESLPDTTISNPEYADEITAYSNACATITKKKQFLADTDYKAMKYAEGAITEEEWLPTKEKRAEARQVINEQEVIRDNYKAKIDEHNSAVVKTGWTWTDQAALWRGDVAILINHLEDFRAWAQNLKAAIIPEEDIEIKEEEK